MRNNREIRIVGSASQEVKDEHARQLGDVFSDHMASLTERSIEFLLEHELEKTEFEQTMLEKANEITSRLMRESDVEPVDIPEENIHILSEEGYQQIAEKGWAVTIPDNGSIFLRAEHVRTTPMALPLTLVHEMMHLKSHFAIKVNDNEMPDSYRGGYKVVPSGKKEVPSSERYFVGLDEAIVSRAEFNSAQELLKIPSLKVVRDYFNSSEYLEAKKRVAEREDILEEAIVWVNTLDETDFEATAYGPQLVALDYICDEIAAKYPERFEDRGAVFKEFLKGHFSGRMLPVARLVDDVFGEGAFRVLGGMTSQESSAVETLNYFKSARK
jgi:hypothetical protein